MTPSASVGSFQRKLGKIKISQMVESAFADNSLPACQVPRVTKSFNRFGDL